jgi:hypothetical protein
MVYYSSSEGGWVRVDEVEWDEDNLHHATLRVSAAEIEQVIDDPASIWRINRRVAPRRIW